MDQENINKLTENNLVRKRLIFNERLVNKRKVFNGEWEKFLKNCNANLYTSRKDSHWYSVRGKGYIIWISPFHPGLKDDLRVWESVFEISPNAPAVGFENLDEIIEGALHTFKGFTVEDI